MTQDKDRTLPVDEAVTLHAPKQDKRFFGFGGVVIGVDHGTDKIVPEVGINTVVSQISDVVTKVNQFTGTPNDKLRADASTAAAYPQRPSSGKKHVLMPEGLSKPREEVTADDDQSQATSFDVQHPEILTRTSQIADPTGVTMSSESVLDLSMEHYASIAEAYLRHSGLNVDQDIDAAPPATRLKKETVTHYGSCGPNSCVIGFCIAVLENKINVENAQEFSKLVQSWNTTYPDDTVHDILSLLDKIRQKLRGGNTTDMENLMGPVIRVYYGIAMQMQLQSSGSANMDPRLTDDLNSSWDLNSLSDNDYALIRDAVVTASADTIEDMCNGHILSLEDVSNPLSFGYYYDQNDLEIIAKELLNIQFVRATQMDIGVNEYKEIDLKIKTNQKVIEKAQEKQLLENESNGILEADPHDVAKKLCSSGESVEYYRFSQDEPSYKAWLKFRSAVQLNWIDREFDVNTRIADAAKAAEQKGIAFDVQACKRFCERVIISAIEREFLAQLSDGNNIIADLSSTASDGIHVVHSGEQYWDALIPDILFEKYSRSRVRSSCAQPAEPNENVAYHYSLAQSLFPDSRSLLPYLNLSSDCALVSHYDANVDDLYDDDDDEITYLVNAISDLCRSVATVASSIHLVIFALSTFLLGIAGSAVFTLSVIAYQTYSHMNSDLKTAKPQARNSEASSQQFTANHTKHASDKTCEGPRRRSQSDHAQAIHSDTSFFGASGNQGVSDNYRPVTA